MLDRPSTLIVPVENQARELDGKLLLSCVAAERGMPVALGSRTFIHYAMPRLPRGLYLAKSMPSSSNRMLRIIQGLGHEVVAWDEESLVRYACPPEYYAHRYSETSFGIIDQLFAWGADDAAFFAAYPGYRGAPIHVTGNPRIDMLRPEMRDYFAAQADTLKAKYGDFVLVNTNFSFVNNFTPMSNLIQRNVLGQPRIGKKGLGLSLPFALGMADHQQAIYDHFRVLMPQLEAWFPDHRIVLRPHPSENQDAWREVLAGCSNTQVVHQGNVVPWLMAARVLLHNGCTTAVEASVLGTPAVSYMPVTAQQYDFHLPNQLSHPASTLDDVRRLVGEVLDGRRGMVDAAVRQRLFDRHLTATQGALSCDRVLDVLEANGYLHRLPKAPPTAVRAKAWMACQRRTLQKRFESLQRHHRNSAVLHAHRFPAVSVDELNARIARFGRLLGRFGGVRAEARSPHVFHIHDPEAMRRTAAGADTKMTFATQHEGYGS